MSAASVLEQAMMETHWKTVKRLLRKETSLTLDALSWMAETCRDEDLWQLIFRNPHFERLKNACDSHGDTLLEVAAQAKNDYLVSWLLEARANFTIQTLNFLVRTCRNPVLWEQMRQHPHFESLKNPIYLSAESLLELAVAVKNDCAIQCLLEVGADLTGEALHSFAASCQNPVIWEKVRQSALFESLKNYSVVGITALYIAALKDNACAVRCLLEAGADLTGEALDSFVGTCQNPMLWEQIRQHPHFESLKNAVNSFGITPLETAASTKNDYMTLRLLEAGVDLTAKALLIFAETCQDSAIWKQILQHPHFKGLENEVEGTLLERAAKSRNFCAVEWLLTESHLFSFVSTCQDLTCWELIRQCSHFERLKNSVDSLGYTLLQWAAIEKNLYAVQHLLEAGVDLTGGALSSLARAFKNPILWGQIRRYPHLKSLKNEVDVFKKSPLEAAVRNNNFFAVQCLLEVGVDLTVEALIFLARTCQDPVVWEQVCQYPLFRHLKDKVGLLGDTPLEMAARSDNFCAVQCLFEAGVDLTSQALIFFADTCQNPVWDQVRRHPRFESLKNVINISFTPLEAAARKKNFYAARCLLEAEVDLTVEALGFFAKSCQDPALWKQIRKHPYFECLKNKIGMFLVTPLERAVKNRNFYAVRCLLEAEVNLTKNIVASLLEGCRDPVIWVQLWQSPCVTKNEANSKLLMSMERGCYIRVARRLLEVGIDLGIEALIFFAETCSEPVLWEKIRQHPHFKSLKNAVDAFEVTPLEAAASMKNNYAVRFLLEAEAQLTESALYFLAETCRDLSLWKQMRRAHYSKNLTDKDTILYIALEKAARNNNSNAIESLLGERSLHFFAGTYRNSVIWKKICQHSHFKSLKNQIDSFGMTLLEVAVVRKNFCAVQCLLEARADLTMRALCSLSVKCRNPEIWREVWECLYLRQRDYFSGLAREVSCLFLELAASAGNVCAIDYLLATRIVGVSDLTEKVLSLLAKTCRNAEIWERIRRNQSLKNLNVRAALEIAARTHNFYAIECLLTGNVLMVFSESCLDSVWWEAIRYHPNFEDLKNAVSSSGNTPMRGAAKMGNVCALRYLLEAGANLTGESLYFLTSTCRDPLIWEQILKNPCFESLKNEVFFGKPLMEVAKMTSNVRAATFLLLGGVDFDKTKCFRRVLQRQILIDYVQICYLNLTHQILEKQRKDRISMAKGIAMFFLERASEEAPADLLSFPNLWLSLIDNGTLSANEESAHRPHISWLANKVREAGMTCGCHPVCIEKSLSQVYQTTVLEQAWAFVALFRMNPSGFVACLMDPIDLGAKEFREYFSKDVFKKIKDLVPVEEYVQMRSAGILGNFKFKQSLALLQSESKSLSQIEYYSPAAIRIGNEWENLDPNMRPIIFGSLIETLVWTWEASDFPCSEASIEKLDQLKGDIWISLGLLMIGAKVLDDMIGSQISDIHQEEVKRQVFGIFQEPMVPVAAPFFRKAMGGAGGPSEDWDCEGVAVQIHLPEAITLLIAACDQYIAEVQKDGLWNRFYSDSYQKVAEELKNALIGNIYGISYQNIENMILKFNLSTAKRRDKRHRIIRPAAEAYQQAKHAKTKQLILAFQR